MQSLINLVFFLLLNLLNNYSNPSRIYCIFALTQSERGACIMYDLMLTNKEVHIRRMRRQIK